ncbi:unnamed protein product [Candidula unifasciata]|uniref:Gamma-aminobutyric acid receptor subunit beta-like n=1 Tax=Candidula unifasciata TaxID=100452 RepID=A0A8S3Z0G7_9EUPU|nr:unnamed protein product [Candidula unifasciata]
MRPPPTTHTHILHCRKICVGWGCQHTDYFGNISETIENLLNGYDIRLRPSFGGDPLKIGIEVILASFDSISEVNMDYTITMYLNQYWRDERLQFVHPGTPNFLGTFAVSAMTLTGAFAEKIWVPDTFLANDKNSFLHDITEKNKMVRLYGNGSLVYGMRHVCTGSTTGNSHGGFGIVPATFSPFSNYEIINKVEGLLTGNYQRLSLVFQLQRNIGYFIFQTYLPSILIVMLSWVSFWINHEATSARVALGITTVLTMTTISNGVRSSLPRISYVKAIDIYLVMCFVFVFAALLEYAAVNYTYWGARAKRKAKRLRERAASVRKRPDDGEPLYPDYISPHRSQDSNLPQVYMSSTSVRRRSVSHIPSRRRRLLSQFRQKAKSIKVKIPRVQDVNTIDKYARLMFPLLFVVFNASYWAVYLLT